MTKIETRPSESTPGLREQSFKIGESHPRTFQRTSREHLEKRVWVNLSSIMNPVKEQKILKQFLEIEIS